MGRYAGEAIGLRVKNGTILPFPAQWTTHGLAAGPIRNQQMLDAGHPTEVWAFHDRLTHSIGTRDMVNRAMKAGLPTWVITFNSWSRLEPSQLSMEI